MRISRLAEKKIHQGIFLLEQNDFETVDFTNQEAILLNQKGDFIGQAYFSKQNKGCGWFYSYEKTELNRDFFQTLFEKAKVKRQQFAHSTVTTAYRVFNQDGDGFGGLTIDLYNDYAVFSWYNDYIYSIKEQIVSAFQLVFPDIIGAYEKIRFRGPNFESAHLYGQEAPSVFTVLENGVRYQVFLNDGLMTGIFLDQHEVRGSLVDGLAAGQSVLNMFSYTAAFSIAAAMGGALTTTSVDLAKRSRELSEAHFVANGIDLADHKFLVMDTFDYFRYAKRHGLQFDTIILDPPSFARNKKQTFSVAKDYHKLISQSLDILSPNGTIIASTNAANVSIDKFKSEIKKGFAGRKHDFQMTYRLPSDFEYNKNDESSNYLKVFVIQVK